MFLSSTTAVTKLFSLAIFVAVAFAIPALASAAELRVAPSSGTYTIGQTFSVSVQVIPTENSANAVEVSLQFDPSILSVVAIDKADSDLYRWTTEPTFSNSAGTIHFGGAGRESFTTKSNLLSVTFRALAPGSGGLSISDASVFATNGLRTDVFAGGAPATFTVSSVVDSNPNQSSNSADDVRDTITIYSDEFVDPGVWYSFKSGKFAWELPSGVEAVAVEIAKRSDNRPNNNPNAIYETPISEFAINPDMLTDGVQYLSLRFRDEDGWGEVINREILIDTTSPSPFAVDTHLESTSAFPRLYFEAVDFASGIAYYEVAIAGSVVDVVSPEEARFGYQLSRLEDGVYDVAVTAYDRAGNTQVSTLEVEVEASWMQSSLNGDGKPTNYFVLTPSLSILILAVIVVLLLFHMYFERKRILLKEAKLAKETYEIQSQMEKIFSALRAEIYDQINTITKRKRLSKAEKEAVEGLSQAVEVSETLIQKEINDVKSILK